MNIFKQTEIKRPIYTVKLENGVVINVYGGYAIGNDGKRYYHVGHEKGDMLETVGWSCDVDGAVVV